MIPKNLEKNYLTKKYGEKNDFAKKLLTKMKTLLCNENFVEKGGGRISKQNRPILFSLLEHIRKCTELSKKMC